MTQPLTSLPGPARPSREDPAPLRTLGPDRPRVTLTTAELAPCTCPEFCERDHDVD